MVMIGVDNFLRIRLLKSLSSPVRCALYVLIRFSLIQAIRMFAKARPPGIYKQHYIEDLYKFYHEPKPQNLVCPSTPEWKRPETPDLNCVATTDQDEDDEDDFMAALQVRIYLVLSS